METKFQTSFIPRKPMPMGPGSLAPQTSRRGGHGTGNLYMTIAVAIFIISLVGIGGVYAWKQYLVGNQAKIQADLALRREGFNITEVARIKAKSSKIILARQLLNNHLAISKIFGVLSKFTAESTRLLSMDLVVPPGAGPLQLSVTAYSKSYQAVAFQSDVLNQLENYPLNDTAKLSSVVKNAIVSNPALNTNGTVTFGFTAQVDPGAFSYVKSLEPVATPAPEIIAPQTTPSPSPTIPR